MNNIGEWGTYLGSLGLLWIGWITGLSLIVWTVLRSKVLSKKAHARRALCWSLMLACVIPPAFSNPANILRHVEARVIAALKPSETLPSRLVERSTNETGVERPGILDTISSSQQRLLDRVATAAMSGRELTLVVVTSLMGMIWLGGAVLITAKEIGAWIWTKNFLRQARSVEITDETVEVLVRELTKALRVKRQVRPLITPDQGLSPAVFDGFSLFLCPFVLVPISVRVKASTEQLRHALAHELIHVLRFDFVWVWLGRVVRIMWWFHPVVSRVVEQEQIECDRSCDVEVVKRLGCNRHVYAETLTDVAGLVACSFPAAVPAMAGDDVRQRVLDIIDPSLRLHKRMPASYWLALVAGLVLFGPAARSQQQRAALTGDYQNDSVNAGPRMNQPAVVSNQSDTEPTLTVVVPHGFLPVELEIRSSNGFKHHRIRRGGGAFELPPGDGTINVVCRSHQNNQFAQPFSLRLADGSVSESSVFQDNNGYYHTLEIDLPAVDSIVLDLHRPVVPWNAELIEIEGDFALATLERPWADFDVKHPRFQSLGRWSDSEPYPNTTLCWARFGSVGMAEELASHLVKLRERNKLDDGGLRGAFHTSISVDSTAPLWQEITATELADHLVKAFESLREHRAPLRDGRAVYHPANLNEERTIEQEISRAREILAEQLTATKGG